MARFLVVYKLAICLCLAQSEVSHAARQFKEMNKQHWRPTRLEPGTTVSNETECLTNSLNRYPDSHVTVMYNAANNTCTLGNMTVTDPSALDVGKGVLYRNYKCSDFQGFSLYHNGSEQACVLYQSELKNYTQARDSCISKGGYLFVPRSCENYNILLEVLRYKTDTSVLLGLHQVEANRLQRLDDFQTVNYTRFSSKWDPSDSQFANTTLRQKCIVVRNGLLRDNNCHLERASVCEIAI